MQKTVNILDAVHPANEALNKVNTETLQTSQVPDEQTDISEEIYGSWFKVDLHLKIAEIIAEEVICNAILNYQTLYLADTHYVKKKTAKDRTPNTAILHARNVSGEQFNTVLTENAFTFIKTWS